MIEVPEDFDLIQFLQSLEAYYRSTKEVPNTVDQCFQQCNDATLYFEKQKWRAIRVGNNVSSVLLQIKERGFHIN